MLLLHSTHLIITWLMIWQLTTLGTSAHKIKIGSVLTLTEKSAEENDPAYEIKCPMEHIAAYRGPINHERKEKIQQLSNLVKVTWKKNNKPFRWRENGIKFDANLDKFKLILYQFRESDTGTYTCLVDYSNVPPELAEQFDLRAGGAYDVIMAKSLPDIKPTITHPPRDFYKMRGDNVTFYCNRTDTLSNQLTVWFRSCPSTNKTLPCIQVFNADFELARQTEDWAPISPYIFNDGNRDSITITNITDDDIGYYGCLVRNYHGIDIRLGSVDFLENFAKFQFEARPESVRQHVEHSHEWIWVVTGVSCFLIAGVVSASCICIFKARLQQGKKQTNPPLLSQITGMDVSGNKDSASRKRLPTIEAPDIYNTGKSIDGFITGHFHQEAGQIMAQSICGNLLNKVNPSISSSNSHQSDEASSFWGKSLSSHHGDHCRAFYSHGSNSTATTVPLYDHPPSTGTLRRCRTFVKDACVSNPSYWLLNPENDTIEWNFPRRNLDRLDKIGEGQFGEVWRYIARSRDGTGSIVAVKKLKDELCASDSERSELRAEIEIMKAVNKHPNVIKLLHCCIDECGPILLIMEYAENGKLQTYLRSCRSTRKQLYCDDVRSPRQNVTSKELIKFTYHIAKGMEYVASQGIVHRDLASRNILVSKDKVCKVADFGFARRVDDDCVYVRKSTNPVPVKWMAPEALEGNKFTLKSDVFSLGILMWEIVTLGATPYEQMTSEGVYKKVTTGGRLERPPHCKDEFFTLMAQCWTHDPTPRPTFKEIAQKLERLLLSENDYIELDQYPEHAYYNIVNSAEKEVVQISV